MTDLHPLILVMDDASPIRRFLCATLLAHGYQVLEANTAQDGLTQAATRLPVKTLFIPCEDTGAELTKPRCDIALPLLCGV